MRAPAAPTNKSIELDGSGTASAEVAVKVVAVNVLLFIGS